MKHVKKMIAAIAKVHAVNGLNNQNEVSMRDAKSIDINKLQSHSI